MARARFSGTSTRKERFGQRFCESGSLLKHSQGQEVKFRPAHIDTSTYIYIYVYIDVEQYIYTHIHNLDIQRRDLVASLAPVCLLSVEVGSIGKFGLCGGRADGACARIRERMPEVSGSRFFRCSAKQNRS